MTPLQRIKRHLLCEAIEHGDIEINGKITAQTCNVVSVDSAYEYFINNDGHWDYESEFRYSGEETDIPHGYSRHYEAKSVATQLSDGTWIGWTYWYGGGKHGNPGEVPWMDEAYFLDMTEEKKTITVRTFTKREKA